MPLAALPIFKKAVEFFKKAVVFEKNRVVLKKKRVEFLFTHLHPATKKRRPLSSRTAVFFVSNLTKTNLNTFKRLKPSNTNKKHV